MTVALAMVSIVAAVAVVVLGRLLAADRTSLRRIGALVAVPNGDPGESRGTEVERQVRRLVDTGFAESLSEERLRLSLDGITQGIVICDDDGKVVVRNAYARSFVQARHGEALVSAAVGELLATARSGTPGEEEVEVYGPPLRRYFVHASPIERGDAVIGAMAVIEETTEIHRIDSVRRDFVANLSHEVKTPIGALGLLAETLVGEDDPETIERLSQRVLAEVERLARMVDDLLVLSRIEHSGLVDPCGFMADRIVVEAVERSRAAAETRSILIDAQVDPGVELSGDRLQVLSAVSNLVDNAVKYSETGSRVDVRVAADAETVAFVVQDRGIGIPARDLDRIFERFYRVDRARSRATGGTGLGLSIVRHVAVNHGGEVRVESREGQGSTFTLLLPRQQATVSAEVPA